MRRWASILGLVLLSTADSWIVGGRWAMGTPGIDNTNERHSMHMYYTD